MEYSIKWGRVYGVILAFALLGSSPALAGESIFLPNINHSVTGTSLGSGHYGLDVSGTFSASFASVGLTGAAVPGSADYVAGNKAGNLTGLLIGQQTMSNSLACTIASDQSAVPISGSITATNPSVSATGAAVPASATMSGGSDGTNLRALKVSSAGVLSVDGSAVTQPVSGTFWQATQPVSGTFWQATQPISASALPLPTGASIASKQPALGTAGSASADVITVQGIASMTALKVDGSGVTQPVSGTVTINALTNTSVVKAQLQDNAGTAVTVGQKTMASSLPVTIASDQVAPKTYANSAGSFVLNTTLTTVVTETAPATAVGFILEASSSNAANIRWAIGATATTSSGMRLEPGRDSGFVPVAASISIVAESGTLEYQLTWIKQ